MLASKVIDAMYDAQPVVFAHRGAMAYAPMNTLPAFERAVEQGAHGIELDVHRSLDGHPVVVHDFRVDETSDGAGYVNEMTLAKLKALDAGAWFDERFAGTRIPTLDEVFEAVGQRVFINVEIKSESDETDGVEQVVVDCIKRHHMQERVLISSFNPLALQRFRALLPDVPVGFLYSPEIPIDIPDLMRNMTYEAYHPHHEMIDKTLVSYERRKGHILNAWTVNDVDRARDLKAMGVAGIITNVPDVMLKALHG